MKKYYLDIKIQKPFHNLTRRRHVIIVAITPENKILVGRKDNFYPPNIMRIIGGGVDKNESFIQAAIRETNEELGIVLTEADLSKLAEFNISATDYLGKKYENSSRVYKIHLGSKFSLSAGDDIDRIEQLSIDELYKLGERYEHLNETLWYINPNYFGGLEEFSWGDYGKVYGFIHKRIAELLKAANIDMLKI